jgi:hypothetical protein
MVVVNQKRRVARQKSPLKLFMLEKVELRLVGDDDSGPEDALDDLDLEYGQAFMLTYWFAVA